MKIQSNSLRRPFYRSTFISIDSVLFGSIPFCFEYLQGRKVKSQLTSLMQNIRQRPSLLDRGSVPKRSVLSDKYFNLNMVHLRTPNSMKDWHEVVISYFYFIFETCILHMIWNIQRMVYAAWTMLNESRTYASKTQLNCSSNIQPLMLFWTTKEGFQIDAIQMALRANQISSTKVTQSQWQSQKISLRSRFIANGSNDG